MPYNIDFISKMAASSELHQFTFCELCRSNHTEFKTHVYCKRHREAINKMLVRFKSKIDEAVASLKSPLIKGDSFEKGANVWCYFCNKDIQKHLFCGGEYGTTICYHSFLNHLQSLEHLKRTKTFWWKNKVDSNVLSQYLVTEDDFESFKEKCSEAKEEHKKKQKHLKQHEVERILMVESQRQDLVLSAENSVALSSLTRSHISAASASRSSDTSSEIVSNIFTGMLPPWLQDDEEVELPKREIHPNANDCEKYLELKKKSRLPSNRVGANFDRDSSTSADWLPSFGCVWNNGRRRATKQQFERNYSVQQNKKHCVRSANVPADDPAFPKVAAARPPPNLNKYIL